MPGKTEHSAVVALFIPTYRRPAGLRRCLRSIARQTFSQIAVDLRVYVIDNDEERSAQPVHREVSRQFPFELSYLVEPVRGISHARNKALAVTSACRESTHLAFLDDDEVAEQDWLEKLLLAQRKFQADVVTGPVHRRFPATVPAWARHTTIFRQERFPDGQKLVQTATGNVLLKAAVVRESGLRFDDRLALTGGEDELFFLQLSRLGYSIHWHDKAIVTEYVPLARLSPLWVARRSMCYGNAVAKLQLIFRGRSRGALYLLAFAGYQNVRAGRQLWRFLKGEREHIWIDVLQYASTQFGVLTGLLGCRLENYKYVEGD